MTESTPFLLHVVCTTDAFRRTWSELAERLELELRLSEHPEPARGTRTVAVVLSCAGRESHAVELLHEAQRAGIQAPILVGSEPDHRLAVELMRRGAAAYFALPPDVRRLEGELTDRLRGLRQERGAEPPEVERHAYDFDAIWGEDPGLGRALRRAAKVIPGARATVLITGETGTGKELLARAIHANGPRAREPFVAVNCSAIPGTLLESELFGHEKGAFTDARVSKPGLFEVADGGTLFLDEVATLPLELQAKLLRFLETREMRRLGGLRDVSVDVRILAATNLDLAAQVSTGAFREDLYFRLAVVPIRLPPLRERGDDVLLLARRFLTELAGDYEVEAPELTPEAARALRQHSWPGNVRELRNAVERALLLSDGDPVRPEHLALAETAPSRPDGALPGGDGGLSFPATMEELELAAATRMIELCGGNKSEAARRLGIARSRLYRILARVER